MRFVAVKTAEMQAVLALHRGRQGLVKARTVQANQIRGLLAEFGIVIGTGISGVTEALPEILEDGENGLPGMMRQLLAGLGNQLKELDRQVRELERQISRWHRDNVHSRKLQAIPGIGPLSASCVCRLGRRCEEFQECTTGAGWAGHGAASPGHRRHSGAGHNQ